CRAWAACSPIRSPPPTCPPRRPSGASPRVIARACTDLPLSRPTSRSAIASRKIESPRRHAASRKKPEFSWCQKNQERLSLADLPPKENFDLFGVLGSWRFILRTDCSIDSTWSRSTLWADFSRIDSSRYLHRESGSQGRQIFPGSEEARTGTRKRSLAVSGQRKSELLGSPAPCEIGSHSSTEDRIERASRFSRSIQPKRAHRPISG